MSGGVGHGWNSTSGYDTGELPPGTSFGGYAGMAGPTYPPVSYPGMPSTLAPYPIVNPWPQPGPPGSVGPTYTMASNGYQNPVPVFPGQPGGSRFPGVHPVVNSECPAMNLQNSTGGMGCEPGYNYYFPAEHTKIHVIKSRVPPWRLGVGTNLRFMAYHVPVHTTLADLMQGFGATNPSDKKNLITEVVHGGGGRWYKGTTFAGSEKSDMKLMLKEVGWDKTRTGRPGEKPVVWLWITKD